VLAKHCDSYTVIFYKILKICVLPNSNFSAYLCLKNNQLIGHFGNSNLNIITGRDCRVPRIIVFNQKLRALVFVCSIILSWPTCAEAWHSRDFHSRDFHNKIKCSSKTVNVLTRPNHLCPDL